MSDSKTSSSTKRLKEKDLDCDALIIGDQLEALLIANELKRRSLSVLLVQASGFPQLKSEDLNQENIEITEDKNFQDINRHQVIEKHISLQNTENLFEWLYENIKQKEEPWPFFYFSRILKNQIKKDWSKNFFKNEHIVSLDFHKRKLRSVLLSGGEQISATWVIFCLSPQTLVKLEGLRGHVPVRMFSRMARFRAWSQIHWIFCHDLDSNTLEAEEIKDLFYTFKTLKYGLRFYGGGFSPMEKKAIPQKKKMTHSSFMSYWLSLIPYETLEETKSLHSHIKSMKKQIQSQGSSLFESKNIKEEKLFIEPENHGFLDLKFSQSFGEIPGIKNVLLSSSLLSPLPSPLSAWDVSKKVMKTLDHSL